MGVVSGVMGALSIGSTLFGMYSQHEQAKAQEAALEEQRRQEHAKANQERIAEDDKLARTLSAQTAQEAASPFAQSSTAFGTVAEQSMNQFADDRFITKLNLASSDRSISQQEANVRKSEFMGIATNLFDAGMNYYDHYKRMQTGVEAPNPFDPMGKAQLNYGEQ